MSLLLDALRRAEEARRAKEAESNAAQAGNAGAVGRTILTQPTAQPRARELSIEEPPRIEPVMLPEIEPGEFVPATSGRVGLELEEIAVPMVNPGSGLDRPVDTARSRIAAEATILKETTQRDGARNVFAAKQPSVLVAGDTGKRKWILPVVAVIFVLLGAGGWYVWNEVNRVSQPTVARAPSRPAGLPSAAPNTGQIVAQSVVAAAPTATKADEPLLPPLLPPQTVDASPAKALVAGGSVTERALTGREALAKNLKDAPVAKEEPTGLRLAPSFAPAKINPELALAYQALASGDYVASQQRYAKVVQAEPLNVDAQLGLATAAARSGDSALAIRHYRQVLALDPRNGLAIVGLIALNDGAKPATLEIELKTLIGRNPDAAPLHFALGNTYAGERRWTEAQQAYFEAFRIEPSNPDYLFNLAVSLDQLRQTRLALDYYRKAEAIAQTRGGGQFDRGTIAKRIRELSGESGRNN